MAMILRTQSRSCQYGFQTYARMYSSTNRFQQKRYSHQYSTAQETTEDKINKLNLAGILICSIIVGGGYYCLEPLTIVPAVVQTFVQTFGNVTAGMTLKQFDKSVDNFFKDVQKTSGKIRLESDAAAQSVYEKVIGSEIEAGLQVKLAIESVRDAYAEALDTTIDKLNPEIQKNLATIHQIVEEICASREKAVADLASRVEQLVLRLPFVDKSPRVYHSTPGCITRSTVNPIVLVRFFGHFPKDKNLRATFTIGQGTFAAEGGVTQLMCQVPNNYFYPTGSEQTSTAALTDGTLMLTWKGDSFWDKLWRREFAEEYKISIVSLPLTPGSISVEYVKWTPYWEKKLKSEKFYQSSAKSDSDGLTKTKEYSVMADVKNGWEVEPNTHQFDILYKRPQNSSYSFVSEDQEKVKYSVITIHHKKPGKSGKIGFEIKFTQRKNVPIKETISENLFLKWKEAIVIDDADRKLNKVIFIDHDGLRYEMAGVNSNNPYVKISNEGGKLVLRAVPPESHLFFSAVSKSKH